MAQSALPVPGNVNPKPRPEAKAAWDKLSPAQKQSVLEQFKQKIGPMVRQSLQRQLNGKAGDSLVSLGGPNHKGIRYNQHAGTLLSTPLKFVNAKGKPTGSLSQAISDNPAANSIQLPRRLQPLDISPFMAGPDSDGDGLSDDFESQIAYGFSPNLLCFSRRERRYWICGFWGLYSSDCDASVRLNSSSQQVQGYATRFQHKYQHRPTSWIRSDRLFNALES